MTGGTLSILLVEDNPGDARLIRELLRNAKQVRFAVEHVGGLAEALKIPRGRGFDAVLLDLDLPESEGIDTVSAAQDIFAEIPILALTGFDDEELALEAMRNGAQDYLVKGEVDTPLLSRAIRYAVERDRTGKELQETAATYRALVDAAPDSVTATDLEGNLTEVSRQTLELHGAESADEMIGLNAFDLIAPEDRERAAENMRKTLEQGSVRNIEYTLLRTNGNRFQAEMSTSLVRDAAGRPKGFIATVRDITERKRAERALLFSHRLLDATNRHTALDDVLAEYVAEVRRFTDCEAVGVRILDAQGNIPYMAHDGFGCEFYEQENRLSIQHDCCMCSEVVKGTLPPSAPYAAGRGSFRTNSTTWLLDAASDEELRAMCNTCNSHGYESVALVPIRTGDRIKGLIHVADRRKNMLSNATVEALENAAMQLGSALERVETLQSLRVGEERYRTLVETSPDGITLCMPDGVIITANRCAAQMLGYERGDDLVDVSFYDLVAEDDRAQARAHYMVLRDTGEPGTTELSLLRKDGTSFAGELNTALVRDDSGAPLALIAIGRDITERRRGEEDARRLDKLESLSILAGGVAHDFNNLLTAVITNLSMAKEDVRDGGDPLVSLKEAAYAAKRARSLTRQLLTFAKGGAPIKKAASVGELLESTAGFVLRGSTCRADFEIPKDLWAAEIDQDQMSQVIENLVINASQAMVEGGSIDIGARNAVLDESSSERPAFLAPGKYISIMIKDSGVGIPQPLLVKVFDPYFTTKQDGSGLGLAVAHTVVQSHGGHIAVDSAPDSGTTFTILLPASEKAGPQSAKQSVVPIRGTGRVLVMDDDPLIQRSLRRMLTRLGYTAEVAPDGEDAIVKYREALADGRAFDAVIMDLTVPGGMGGVETIKELKRLDPQVKAIVSSGYSTDQVMSDHKRYGFEAVVTKPYDIEDMAIVLSELICGTPQELEAMR